MRRRTEEDRRARSRGAAWGVLVLLVLGTPAVAGASDALPEAGRIDASPAERIASGLEGLWHSLVDGWRGVLGIAAAEAGDGADPDVSTTSDPCDPVCSERNVDLDPDG